VLAAAFAVTSWLLDGVTVSGGFWGYVLVSAVFGVVNAILGTFLRIISIPFILLTLGLFLILINAFLLHITDAITSDLTIDSFWWTTIWAAIILSLATIVIDGVIGKQLRD